MKLQFDNCNSECHLEDGLLILCLICYSTTGSLGLTRPKKNTNIPRKALFLGSRLCTLSVALNELPFDCTDFQSTFRSLLLHGELNLASLPGFLIQII